MSVLTLALTLVSINRRWSKVKMKTSTFCKLVKRYWITSGPDYVCICAYHVASSLSAKTKNKKLKAEYKKHASLMRQDIYKIYLEGIAYTALSYAVMKRGSTNPQAIYKFRLKMLNSLIHKFKAQEELGIN